MKKELIFKSIRWVLTTGLKLSAVQVWIAMHILDAIWIGVVQPFIKAEKRYNKYQHKVNKKQALIKQIKETHKDQPFREQVKAIWKVIQKKEENVKR